MNQSKRSIGTALAVMAIVSSAAVQAQEINDLVFIHHSCGSNWLSSGLDAALTAKSYIDERNDITYGTTMTPDAGRPASLGAVPGDNTNMNHWILWFNDYLKGVRSQGCASGFNRIVLFKSCYPVSAVASDGIEPGDPFDAAQSLANYRAVYRHPGGAGRTYSNGGATYKPIEDIFAENPDVLFIAVTAPPLNWGPSDATSDAEARRARRFNNWLKNEWLPSYHAAHPALDNAAVFDWFDFLAFADDDPSHPDRLKTEYGGDSGDSHPNGAGNAAGTAEFVKFIDAAWKEFSTNSVLVEIRMMLEGPYAEGGRMWTGVKKTPNLQPGLQKSDNPVSNTAGKSIPPGPSVAGGSMTTFVQDAGYVPLTSPYPEDRRTVPSIPSDVVDWVLVQLRYGIHQAALVSKSALLRRDGKVVSDNGTTLKFDMDAENGYYYIVIRHRNHLAVMSAVPVSLSKSGSALYDFSVSADQCYGGETRLLESGVFGLFAGDVNGSGAVDANDRSEVWNDLDKKGYFTSDCNLSGIVDINDLFITWDNRNRKTMVP